MSPLAPTRSAAGLVRVSHHAVSNPGTVDVPDTVAARVCRSSHGGNIIGYEHVLGSFDVTLDANKDRAHASAGYCGLLAICISNIVTMVFLMTSTSLDLLGQTHTVIGMPNH